MEMYVGFGSSLHSILEVKVVISRKQEIGSDQFSSFLFFVHLGSHEKGFYLFYQQRIYNCTMYS